jgi:hypothetical protein
MEVNKAEEGQNFSEKENPIIEKLGAMHTQEE